uniref:ABC transporter ATP-binding protein n=1 Tax=Eubacterium sp. TaxID=142586 RepID=UPI00402703B7
MKSVIYENTVYMIKNWFKWDKKSIAYFIIRIPALVIQPIITALIPKAMIDCINNHVSVGELAATVAVLSALVALTTWLAPFMQELILGSARIIRMRYAVMAFDKNLNADYVQIESLQGREMNQRAGDFYRSFYAGSADFFETLNMICVSVIGIITSAALIYKINFFIILLIIATCVVEAAVLRFLNSASIKMRDKENDITTKFNYFYAQSKNTAAGKDIRIYSLGDRFIAVMAQLVYEIDKLARIYTKTDFSVSGVRALLNLLRELVAYAYLTYLAATGKLSVSDFIFYFGIITGFSNWIVSLVYCISSLERCCNQCSRYREYVEGDSFEHQSTNNNTPSAVDSIEFKDISFAYPQSDKTVLNNISFKVSKGENIAIVGENGAGKTTLIKLLCGLYKTDKGEIIINSKTSSEFEKGEYFSLFSPVFQDYSFLPLTVAQNIAASLDFDKEKVISSLKSAGIYDKIKSLPNGINTKMIKEINKDAEDFSGGEKQKLLLAKAVFKNAPVLILDEPTAALDPIAENELYLKYNELTKGKISFFISHRLSSTRFCDKIFFISDGKIAESGTHEELMALKGKYYRMYQLQSYYYQQQGVRYE